LYNNKFAMLGPGSTEKNAACGPSVKLRVNRYTAMVICSNTLDGSHTKSPSLKFGGKERLKHAFHSLLIHTFSVIPDGEAGISDWF